jgi:hypothetical protein
MSQKPQKTNINILFLSYKHQSIINHGLCEVWCRCTYSRDRSFNLQREGYGFLFRSEFFFRTTRELEYLFFLSRKARIFFPRIQH